MKSFFPRWVFRSLVIVSMLAMTAGIMQPMGARAQASYWIPPKDAVWQLQWTNDAMGWLTVSPAGPTAAIRFVTYRCESVDGTSGLWRTSQSVGAARLRQPPAPELLLPGCEQLSLRYAGLPADPSQPLEWVTEWNGVERGLPRLVELTVRLTSGSAFSQRFAIPR